MKKIAAAAVIATAVFGIVASVSALIVPTGKTASNIEVSSASQVQKTYVLKEYKGQIGIFTSDSSTPDSVLDVTVDALPEYDKQSLQKGIYVTGESQLNSLIEDLTS